MRLFEVAGNQFQDDLANVLKVMQGQANNKKTTSVVLWADINNRLNGYGQVNQDMMDKVKDQVDPEGNLIQAVTPEGIVLKTIIASPEQPEQIAQTGAAPSVDSMAHSAAQDSLG